MPWLVGDIVYTDETGTEGIIREVDDSDSTCLIEYDNDSGYIEALWIDFVNLEMVRPMLREKLRLIDHGCNPLCAKCMIEPRKVVEF